MTDVEGLFQEARRVDASAEFDAGAEPARSLSGARWRRRFPRVLALIASDAIGVIFGTYLVVAVRQFSLSASPDFWQALHGTASGHGLLTLLYIAMIGWLEGYKRRWSVVTEVVNSLKAVITLLCFDVAFRFVFSLPLSEADLPWYGALWISIFVSVLTWHWISVWLLIKIGLWADNVLVIGTGQTAMQFAKFLNKSAYYGMRVVGFIGLDKTKRAEVDSENCVLTDWDTFISSSAFSTARSIDFVFAMEIEDLARCTQMASEMALTGAHCTVVAPLPALPFNSTEMVHFSQLDYLSLSVRSAKSIWRDGVKRLVDVVGASLMLILLCPLMLGIAWVIWRCDGRPIIYRQIRRGRNGKPFTFLKFRTMYRDADEKLKQWQENNHDIYAEYVAGNFKLRNDPRVIPVGRLLRETSADELPQLFNVLLGQMSLVGPRPVLPREVAHYEGGMFYYDLAVPGITGLWQVAGRSELGFADRAQLDRSYVKNRSLWGDFILLFATIRIIALKKGAY